MRCSPSATAQRRLPPTAATNSSKPQQNTTAKSAANNTTTPTPTNFQHNGGRECPLIRNGSAPLSPSARPRCHPERSEGTQASAQSQVSRRRGYTSNNKTYEFARRPTVNLTRLESHPCENS